MIVLFGGTFDPVHNGHLHAARALLDLPGVDAVHLIVSADPPHRHAVAASARDRLHMLRLACEGIAGLVPDDCELDRPGPSYSVDTLLLFRARFPASVLAWAVGLDAFLGLPTWSRYTQVLELADLVVLKRPGVEPRFPPPLSDIVTRHRVARFGGARAGELLFVEAEMLPVSASDLRRRLGSGESVADLLPAQVATYIRSRRLYV